MYSDLHLSIIISPLRTTSPIVNHKPGPPRAAPAAGQTDSPLNGSGLTQAPLSPRITATQALSGQGAPPPLPSLSSATHNLRIASQVCLVEKKKAYCWHFICIITLWTKSRTASFSLYQNLFLPQGTALYVVLPCLMTQFC